MTKNNFKEAMAHVATGVAILSCSDKDELFGMTVSSLTSVGLSPAMVSVVVEGKSKMVDAIRRSRRFGASVLLENQKAIGQTFSQIQTPYLERFKSAPYEIINGCPLILGSLVKLTCEVAHEIPISENIIFFGRVTHVESSAGRPLLYFHRNWQELAR